MGRRLNGCYPSPTVWYLTYRTGTGGATIDPLSRTPNAGGNGRVRAGTKPAAPGAEPRTSPPELPSPYAVVGAGRLGTLIYRRLRRAGYESAGYATATAHGARRAQKHLGIPASDMASLVGRKPALWLLTVPDDAIAAVAAELADAYRRQSEPSRVEAAMANIAVVHTSGAASVAELDVCARLGAHTISAHPLQTVMGQDEPNVLEGTRMAITTETESAWAVGHALSRALGAEPFRLPDEKKTLYHAAAVVASNYLVALAGVAEDIFALAGIDGTEAREGYVPLMRRALENVASAGPAAALTGPVSRGDGRTLEKHLEALREVSPRTVEEYRTLARAALALAERQGNLTPARIEHLNRLLEHADGRLAEDRTDAGPPELGMTPQ